VLLTFLSVAEHFRHWGGTMAPGHQSNPTPWLAPETTWRCLLPIEWQERTRTVIQVASLPDSVQDLRRRYNRNSRL
jgi:hypothetical protein